MISLYYVRVKENTQRKYNFIIQVYNEIMFLLCLVFFIPFGQQNYDFIVFLSKSIFGIQDTHRGSANRKSRSANSNYLCPMDITWLGLFSKQAGYRRPKML